MPLSPGPIPGSDLDAETLSAVYDHDHEEEQA